MAKRVEIGESCAIWRRVAFRRIGDRKLCVRVLVLAVLCLAGTLIAARLIRRTEASSTRKMERVARPTATGPAPKSRGLVQNGTGSGSNGPPSHVQTGQLWPEFQAMLNVLGNRFSNPGKERVVLSGSIFRPNSSGSGNTFQLTFQLPNLMRLEETVNGSTQVTVFNGQQVQKTGGAVQQEDEDLIETLVYDTVGHVLLGQAAGKVALREVGQQFRLDDGSSETYSDAYYDVFQVIDQISIGPETTQRAKEFYVNSSTLLPERVRYVVSRNGSDTEVEVQNVSWRSSGDQMFPFSIQRSENGQMVLQLKINTISYGAAGDPSIFNQP